MFIAEIDDDCILGVDFLKLIDLHNVFDPIFLEQISDTDTAFKCSRVESVSPVRVPSNLAPFFESSSQYLKELEL
ncbi:hypothetical protein ALC60_13593 [Trachymyrmex zeteki]|uniref:Uncharacterized protein n=1 Tax=Mycetomoellerius zeteki TaxID=64791 RepID=A0A151WHS3_9HYME|nr:hypothetical protein ALC60_13593 [Trachymyrmex zeteki]